MTMFTERRILKIVRNEEGAPHRRPFELYWLHRDHSLTKRSDQDRPCPEMFTM